MRRLVGWLALLLGGLAVVAGVTLLVVFGSDDTVSSGPHRFDSSGAAVVSAPEAITYSGPMVRIDAQVEGTSSPVFVGVGRDVDVSDYVRGVAVTRVDEVSVPFETVTTAIEGRPAPEADPRDLDWWLVQDSGNGSASITLALPDETIDIVVMDPALRPGFRPTVTVGVVQKGAFGLGLALLVGGVGLALAGWAWRVSSRPPAAVRPG